MRAPSRCARIIAIRRAIQTGVRASPRATARLALRLLGEDEVEPREQGLELGELPERVRVRRLDQDRGPAGQRGARVEDELGDDLVHAPPLLRRTRPPRRQAPRSSPALRVVADDLPQLLAGQLAGGEPTPIVSARPIQTRRHDRASSTRPYSATSCQLLPRSRGDELVDDRDADDQDEDVGDDRGRHRVLVPELGEREVRDRDQDERDHREHPRQARARDADEPIARVGSRGQPAEEVFDG